MQAAAGPRKKRRQAWDCMSWHAGRWNCWGSCRWPAVAGWLAGCCDRPSISGSQWVLLRELNTRGEVGSIRADYMRINLLH